MRPHVSLEMEKLSAGRRYDLMASLVVPRPIAFVSTLDGEGRPNLAPFSYFMVGGVNPPSLAFCPVLDAEARPKDTLANIEQTGEFVVNLVDRAMAEGMNETSYPYAEGEAEWPASGFEMAPSVRVKPPRVMESPVQFECRLFRVVRHGDGPSSSAYVVGEVLVAHVSEALVGADGRVLAAFEPIARLGGKSYLDLACGKVFELARPIRPSGSSLD
jgi:flavin reductase (DIM6/NTAB) family NADH-FMN oxidoreductase RutF